MISLVVREIGPSELEVMDIPEGFEVLELSPNKYCLCVPIEFGYNLCKIDHVLQELMDQSYEKQFDET